MDDPAKVLLARVLERLQDHERRLGAVEVLAGPTTHNTQELIHRRRIAILGLRERGLTIDAIAKALAVSRGSVLKIVRGIPPPENARAVDGRRIGKRHPPVIVTRFRASLATWWQCASMSPARVPVRTLRSRR
jgi:hypothetical protein